MAPSRVACERAFGDFYFDLCSLALAESDQIPKIPIARGAVEGDCRWQRATRGVPVLFCAFASTWLENTST